MQSEESKMCSKVVLGCVMGQVCTVHEVMDLATRTQRTKFKNLIYVWFKAQHLNSYNSKKQIKGQKLLALKSRTARELDQFEVHLTEGIEKLVV